MSAFLVSKILNLSAVGNIHEISSITVYVISNEKSFRSFKKKYIFRDEKKISKDSCCIYSLPVIFPSQKLIRFHLPLEIDIHFIPGDKLQFKIALQFENFIYF